MKKFKEIEGFTSIKCEAKVGTDKLKELQEAGKDPFEEYKLDSFAMFKDMVSCIRNEIITYGLQPQMKFGEYIMNNISSTSKAFFSKIVPPFL